MRTTVDLPDDLLRAAKSRAAERGESLKDLLTRAIAGELGRPPRGRATGRVVLPLVGDEGAPKVPLSNADIEAALAAEEAERYGIR
jgi:hypothetical protein